MMRAHLLTAAKKNWLHCASNENMFYFRNVVFKIKFVLQNRQLSLAANR
jgi:hypothetical protein